MIKKNYMSYKFIVMILMMACVIWLGGERCIVEAQTRGQIICTNNTSGYPNATVLNVSNTDFFASTYVRDGKKVNPLELHIKQDTTLVINGPLTSTNSNVGYRQINDNIVAVNAQERNYLEGILVYPGKTLTIKLESNSNFYVYGKKEPHSNGKDWMGHAGIEVPYSATLIIEQTKNVNGALIVLGSSSKGVDDIGNGTGAGIGGRGYEFFKKASVYRGDVISGDYTYSDCGTVIIRSGTIYACGGCGVGEDGKGTGAGIGGGGVWKGKETDHGGKIYSGRGGGVRIYGGKVEAYGGGTFNNNGNEKNIYGDRQDIFFNSNNGFYITNLGTISDDQAEGTGAGIGGGGLYVDKELDVYMNTDLALKYYGGSVDAFAGRGSKRSILTLEGSGDNWEETSSDSRGVGAGIGGGGGFASDGDMKSRATFKACQAVEVGTTYGYTSDEITSTNRRIMSHYSPGIGSAYNSFPKGINGFAKLGGWCCNEKNCNSYNDAESIIGLKAIEGSSFTNYGGGGTPTGSSYPVYKYPKEAYSDVVDPKFESMTYAVCDFEDLENSDVGNSLTSTNFSCNSVEDAINAAGTGVTSKSNLVAKITISDKDTGYIENFGYTLGHGIREINGPGTITVRDMFESYNSGGIKKIASNIYIKVLEGNFYGGTNIISACYGYNEYNESDPTKDKFTFYASRIEVYVITRGDFNIRVKDIGYREKSATVEVEMPEYEEDLEVLVQYILKTDSGGTYPDMQESDAFDGVKMGETVVSEDLVITVTSNLSGGSDAISEMVLKKGDDALKTVNDTNTMTYTATENNTYVLHVKSKFGTEMDVAVKVTKIGEKKDGSSSTSSSGFLIPSISVSSVSFNDTTTNNGLINNATSGLTIDSATSPGTAASLESVELPVDVSGVQVSVPELNLDEISESDLSIGSIESIRLDSSYDKINWTKNKNVDWNNTTGRITEICLRYKDVNSKDLYNVPLYQDSQLRSPLDIDNTIYTNGNSNSYVVGYYMQDRTSSGNGYTKLENYSNTYEGSIQNKMGVTDIVDIPYEGDKAISIRCEYSNGNVKAILEPEGLIVGSRIKEVGVRVEYELNGITTGLVHKWNYVEGQNGVFQYAFANIPKNNVKYSAYYITRDNEEFATIPI